MEQKVLDFFVFFGHVLCSPKRKKMAEREKWGYNEIKLLSTLNIWERGGRESVCVGGCAGADAREMEGERESLSRRVSEQRAHVRVWQIVQARVSVCACETERERARERES